MIMAATITDIRANIFANVIVMNWYLKLFLCVNPESANSDKTTPVCGIIVNAEDAIALTRCIASGLTPIAK